MSLKSHPFFKNRISTYHEKEIKTWVDDENYNLNDIMIEDVPVMDFSSYYNSREHIDIISYETEIEGLYCLNAKFLFRNSDLSDDHLSCLDIYWNCNDCLNCDKRRRLKIMRDLDKRYRYHTDLNPDEMYTITMKLGVDDTPSKLSKKIKYLQNKENNQLMWLIKDTDKSKIVFLMQGVMSDNTFNFLDGYRLNLITKDEVINMVNVRDKYRMLGLFYNKVPNVEFAGMTKEEIDELSKVKSRPKDRCACGELMTDHTIRSTKNQYDFDMYVIPEKHYVEEHKKFKKKYIN